MSKKGDLEAFGGQRDLGSVVIELQHCTSSANFLIQRISGYLTKIFGIDTGDLFDTIAENEAGYREGPSNHVYFEGFRRDRRGHYGVIFWGS